MAGSEEDRHLKLAGEFDCDATPLATLRHSTSHVMAQAVKRLFGDVTLAIGPAIEDGFYYDFEVPRPFTEDDLSRIEEKMAEVSAAAYPFERKVVAKEEARVADVQGITWREGDAEALPFPDASFDVVLSTVGAMFAPNQERTAAELIRVCRPGGKIGMANWTPDGFIGEMFRITSSHVRPTRPIPSPVLWGQEETVRERLGSKTVGWASNTKGLGATPPFHTCASDSAISSAEPPRCRVPEAVSHSHATRNACAWATVAAARRRLPYQTVPAFTTCQS